MHDDTIEVVKAFLLWISEFGYVVNDSDGGFICDNEQLVYDYLDELNSTKE